MDDRDQDSNSFPRKFGNAPARLLLVRCWLERDGDHPTVLRGEIRDENNERICSFQTFADFRARLVEILAPGAPGPVL